MDFLKPDPAPNTVKRLIVRYRSISGTVDEERRFWEHQEYDVGRDIEWLRSGSWCVDEAEWYRQSFDGIDGKSNEGIPVGNGIFDGKDPDVDTTTELSICSCASLARGPIARHGNGNASRGLSWASRDSNI